MEGLFLKFWERGTGKFYEEKLRAHQVLYFVFYSDTIFYFLIEKLSLHVWFFHTYFFQKKNMLILKSV